MMTVPFYPLNLTIQKSALRADFIIVEDRWEVTPSCWEVQVVLFNWSEGQGETGPLTEVKRWR